jgi:phospholipase/carboxylesterase
MESGLSERILRSFIKILKIIFAMDLKFIVREPENITSQTQMLVMLHGYGSNEEDLFSFRHDLPEDWIIVSLRAPTIAIMKDFLGMILILIMLKNL